MNPARHVEMFRPGRSVFDLSHYHLFDCDLGQLIPVVALKMVPGDHFRVGNEIVIRANPMVAPIMHEINVYVHYFFCPLRLLWPKPNLSDTDPDEEGSWEDFFTAGVDGMLEPQKPKWIPPAGGYPVGSLWDYLIGPPGVVPTGMFPDPWYKRAYNFVYNEYYRDQNYMDEVDFDDDELKVRCWEKDYFTTALPWEQRGQAPALPITGTSFADFLGSIDSLTGTHDPSKVTGWVNDGIGTMLLNNYNNNMYTSANTNQIRAWFNNNKVDLSSAATFDVNDLRLAFQTQKFLERNARAGARYIEQLRAHYGVSPRDDRLQRPEYIGGTRSPLVVSEVLQTSSTDSTSPQGNLAGHGMTVDRQYASSYYAQEFGIMIGIMSMMPRPIYQQGIPRELLGETRYDELLPEFVHLGEQPVYGAEIYASNNEADNTKVFGFNGRFDEYRSRQSRISGHLRSGVADSLAFWHIGRSFASSPGLNSDFLQCRPRKDFLAVPSKPGFVVTFGNRIRAVRPLPVVGTPGLIDHR